MLVWDLSLGPEAFREVIFCECPNQRCNPLPMASAFGPYPAIFQLLLQTNNLFNSTLRVTLARRLGGPGVAQGPPNPQTQSPAESIGRGSQPINTKRNGSPLRWCAPRFR